MRKMFLLLGFFLLLATFAVCVAQVQSQQKYPTRAIDIIVPFAPGGGVDTISRIAAAYLKPQWGVPINVVNKAGGNTVPGCLEVQQAAPDGYTMLGDSMPSSSMLGVVQRGLPFKVMDRTFIGTLDTTPGFLLVPPTSPFKRLEDLIAEVKRDPANFTWTSLGGVSFSDYAARRFFKAIGVDISKTRPIMCPGGPQAIALTAGNNVKLGLLSGSTGFAAMKGGLVRTLATTGETRHPEFPDLPTTTELGYPKLTATQWRGISGPLNLPLAVIEIWNKALEKMTKDPEIISKFKNVGSLPYYHNAKEMRELILKEIEEMEDLWS